MICLFCLQHFLWTGLQGISVLFLHNMIKKVYSNMNGMQLWSELALSWRIFENRVLLHNLNPIVRSQQAKPIFTGTVNSYALSDKIQIQYVAYSIF